VVSVRHDPQLLLGNSVVGGAGWPARRLQSASCSMEADLAELNITKISC
jgi:hypothetical protein